MINLRRTSQWMSCLAAMALVGCGSSSPSGSNTGTGGTSGGTGGTSGGTGGTSGGTGGTSGGTGGASASALTGNGCAGNACQNPMCKPLGTAVPLDMYPSIGFEVAPAYIPPDTIIPTFDDVPDGANDMTDSPVDFAVYGPGQSTKSILDFLDMNSLHMDFFINTNNWCGNVLEDVDCVKAIASILKTQNPANHTIHHIHMGLDTPPDTTQTPAIPTSCGGATSGITCEEEIKGVESLVASISQSGRPHLTRFRAPFGEPFQASGPGLDMVQKIVAKYAVEVGWHMDSLDSADCNSTTGPCFTGQQIYDNVVKLIGNAPGQRYGVLLMHGTFPWTKDAVPKLFDPKTGYIATHGFKLATVEDAICWKYGMHSWDIVKQLSGADRGPN